MNINTSHSFRGFHTYIDSAENMQAYTLHGRKDLAVAFIARY